MIRFACAAILLIVLGTSVPAAAASARVIKVLPHFLDKNGRHSLSPSLYERDAYQAVLRQSPALRSGIRFDIQWKAPLPAQPATLRLEVRGSKAHFSNPLVVEKEVQPRRFRSRWTGLLVPAETYEQLGEVVAWRVSLWRDGQMITDQRSFLW